MDFPDILRLSHDQAVVLFFEGINCAPCKALKPVLLGVMEKRRTFAIFTIPPTAENREHFIAYNVRSAPTVIYLRGGREMGRFTGMRSAEQVSDTLDRWGVQRSA